MPTTRTLLRTVAVILATGPIITLSSQARSAPSYSIVLQGVTQTSASPIQDTFHAATPGVAPTLIDEDAAAFPAHVGSRTQLRTAWPFEMTFGLTGASAGEASTDDFVIVGPPGAMTVSGSMHFRATVRLEHAGGLTDSDRHIARARLHVTAATLAADGVCWSGNLTDGAEGVFTGQVAPEFEASFEVTGTFPVGEPFAVSMRLDSECETWGDSSVSPGLASSDGWTEGVTLGDQNGRVMDLPAGYFVQAPSWRVFANRVDVPAVDAQAVSFTGVAPNPSAGSTTFRFSLPRAGEGNVVMTDVQGREVRRLATGKMNAGPNQVVWDGRDDSGARVAPGVYLAVLRFANHTATRRVVRVR
jgi:FlgD Ig-like domain